MIGFRANANGYHLLIQAQCIGNRMDAFRVMCTAKCLIFSGPRITERSEVLAGRGYCFRFTAFIAPELLLINRKMGRVATRLYR
jgi:hypothetical protein